MFSPVAGDHPVPPTAPPRDHAAAAPELPSQAAWAVPWLRLEGAALLVLSLAGWSQFVELSLWVFAATFLLPDLAMLGYLAGPRSGALAYNLAHTTAVPGTLLTVGVLAAQPALVPVALVWLAHVGFDRMLGYGLKSRTAFRFTHLGTIGRRQG